jgi:ribokinase
MSAAGGPVALLVLGPIARDLTMAVDRVPERGEPARATASTTAAGGKGANPAVAAARLGARVRLLGTVGDDPAGRDVLAQLRADGIDLGLVQMSSSSSTGEIVALVEPDGGRRYIEHVGANDDIALSCAQMQGLCGPDTTVLISTALPRAVVTAAAQGARSAGAFTVADLSGEPSTAAAALQSVSLVRADRDEARALTGIEVDGFDSAAAAGHWLLDRGPRTAAVEAGDDGDLLLSSSDEPVRLPRLPVRAVDATGGGDAFVATLAVLLAEGCELEAAGRLAVAAAAHTVGHLGGRPTFADRAALRGAAAG